MHPDPRLPIPGSPQCAVLTPTGRGAIATIAVRGVRAIEVVSRRFAPAAGKPLPSFAVGRVLFGRFRTSAEVPEELVVGLVAPGEIEIHCHGGQAAVQAICEALIDDGCALVTADEWIHEQESDPLAAQAMLALADARTESAAAILLDQYRGVLMAELCKIEELLARPQMAAATAAIEGLLTRAEIGVHLTRSWKIVIAGAPNAGKSSLINAILGYERAIVFPQPGTTRDVLTAATAIGGWPVELADTAGLRAAADALEAEGVARAERQIAAADLVVFVADTTTPWDDPLYRQASQDQARRPIVVHNKCDLSPPLADGRPTGIEISARTRQGIDTLLTTIAQSLVPDRPGRGEPVPFTIGQVAALNDAAAQLAQVDLQAAQQRLTTLRLSGQ